jgi:gliding motility-associated-like protein
MKTYILLFLSIFIGLNFSYSQEIEPINSQYKFIENKGQWPEQVNFKAQVHGGAIWLEDEKITYQFTNYPHVHGNMKAKPNQQVQQHVIWAKFIEASSESDVITANQSKEYYNFFRGNDKSKWASEAYAYSDITFKNKYPGIDLRTYEKNGFLKYDFILQPNAKNVIQIQYEGHDKIKINKKGELIIQTSLGEVIEEKPYAYQIKNGKIINIPCSFQLKKDLVSFNLGDYDHTIELIIDPILVFASYIGSPSDNFGMTATYDLQGNLYTGGMVYGAQYPTVAGAYDPTGNFTTVNGSANAAPTYGVTDVFITKYEPNGTSLIYSTYLGGGGDLGGTESVHSLICDTTGNLHMFGSTSSQDFPLGANPIQDSIAGGNYVQFYNNGASFFYNNGLGGGVDLFITKFNPAGTALLGSTYLGGTKNDGLSYNVSGGNYASVAAYDSLTKNYGDQFRGEIMLDDSGYVYISSTTYSDDFPINNGFQTSSGGSQDAIILKIGPDLDTLIWSSYLGGSDKDAAYSVKLNTSGEVVIAGGTCSNDFPSTPGSYDPTFNAGKTDGFIGIISNDGTTLQELTFLGTNAYDQTFFVEIDRWDNIYAISQCLGAFPVSGNVYLNPNGSQLLTKFNPTLTALSISTVFGNGNGLINISPSAFLVDVCGNIYVSGWGSDIFSSIALSGMPITPNAFQDSPPSGKDFYLIVLSRDFENLIYGSYIGGPQAAEHVDGGTSRFDKNGIVYQSVCGGCGSFSDFPTSPGAWSSTNNSTNCNNLVFKFDFEIIPKAEFTTDVTEGCAPFTVTFLNSSSDSTNYLWDFGDGDTTSQIFNPIKTYDTPGVYEIKLLVTDTICLLVDTAEITITVFDSLVITTMNDTVICGPSTFDIWASSYGTSAEYQWSSTNQFLDTLNTNLTDSVVSVSPGNAQYYYVRVTNPWCTEIDSVHIDFIGSAIQVSPDTNICDGQTIQLGVVNLNPSITLTYDWQPASLILSGQGTSTVTVAPSTTTTFTVHATSNNGCSITEDIIVGVYYLDPTTVFATADMDTIFEGGSTTIHAFPDTLIDQYIWSPVNDLTNPFAQSTVANPSQTTTYTVIVKKGGCYDTAQVTITVLENVCGEPGVFIPNAFTPNDDGNNDIVYVRGGNIERMTFRIFDRWGELMFETNDQNVGWDGKFQNKLMNPDVYVFYLDVTCIGGDEQLIKGNITIIR